MIIRDYVRNPKGFRNVGEIEAAAVTSASIMKLMCGVGNNATHEVLCNAHDYIKKHSQYKGRVAGLFKKVFKDWRMYESNLLYATKNRFFHVADMPEQVRSMYGDITDKEYFEYWQGLGASVYVNTKPLISALNNKFRLSLQQHNVEEADIAAWGLTGSACLQLSCHMYDMATDSCCDIVGLQKKEMRKIFKPLLLDNISKAWNLACDELSPGMRNYKLSEFEEGNISLSFKQILEKWTNPVNIYDAVSACIEDYAEVFKSKKALRLAIAEINDMKEETIEERRKMKIEQLKKKEAV